MKRRLIRTLITGTVVGSLIVAPVYAAPQDDVESLENQKSQAEAQAASVNQNLVDLLVEYEALQTGYGEPGEGDRPGGERSGEGGG